MPDSFVTTTEQLEAIYGKPLERAVQKELPALSPEYRPFIEHAPFMVLASVGPEGVDCSPRGDAPGFVRILDDKTLAVPDRRGNNRIDTLRNIVRDPRVALLFLIPGIGNTLRVNGRARLSIEPDLLSSFAVDGKPPRSVMVMNVDAVYFQCARALVRSDLWNPARHRSPKELPSAGDILAALSKGRVGGEVYDKEWPGRAAKTMW
jgi:PPOX class probable FMN-dependent enzyme